VIAVLVLYVVGVACGGMASSSIFYIPCPTMSGWVELVGVRAGCRAYPVVRTRDRHLAGAHATRDVCVVLTGPVSDVNRHAGQMRHCCLGCTRTIHFEYSENFVLSRRRETATCGWCTVVDIHIHTASRQISNTTCNTRPDTHAYIIYTACTRGVNNLDPEIYTLRSSCAGEGKGERNGKENKMRRGLSARVVRFVRR
jgi:hypothetical protein